MYTFTTVSQKVFLETIEGAIKAGLVFKSGFENDKYWIEFTGGY